MDNKQKKYLQLKIWRQTQVLVRASLALPTFLVVPIMAIEVSWTSTINMYIVQCAMYRVVFLTGPPDFQYQNEKQVAANQD